MPASPSVLQRAADILSEHRSGSAALLQRHLKIGYGEAMRLLAQLASIGLVEAPNPEGRYRVHSSMELHTAWSASERHARVLRDLALYLVECRGALDTRCIDLLLQSQSCDMSALRDVVATLEPDTPHPVLGLGEGARRPWPARAAAVARGLAPGRVGGLHRRQAASAPPGGNAARAAAPQPGAGGPLHGTMHGARARP